MNVIEKGTLYEVSNVEGDGTQQIRFHQPETESEKVVLEGKKELIDGTTDREVLSVIAHRAQNFHGKAKGQAIAGMLELVADMMEED